MCAPNVIYYIRLHVVSCLHRFPVRKCLGKCDMMESACSTRYFNTLYVGLPYLNPKNVLVKGPARNWTIKKDFGEDQIALILMFLRSELNGNRSNTMSNIILYESKQTNCGEIFYT